MKIELAKENEIPKILEIIKERCDWFEKNEIDQWGRWYYEELYDEKYFKKMMKKYLLYVVKKEEEIVGVFLLKTDDDKIHWNDQEKSYYLWHLVTKIGHPGLGEEILEFIENLAKENKIKYLRLECMRSNPKINEYYEKHGFQNKGEGDEPYEYRLWEKEIK